MGVRVGATRLLKGALSEAAYFELRTYFGAWKADLPQNAKNHYWFGKDAAYFAPKVNGKYRLMHVHLWPVENQDALAAWNEKWDNYHDRTSDRVLVYVCDEHPQNPTYLLIAVLPEGSAHRIAEMRTGADADLMNQFARVAEDFLDRGEITA